MSELRINSAEYWDNRFETGSWDENDGEEQSLFFYRLAAGAFPDWLRDELKANEWSFFDYGCAEGAGTAHIKSVFPNLQVTGIDLSGSAVKIAEEKHNNCRFLKGDITAPAEDADIVFTSNTLEHLEDPLGALDALAGTARRYVIAIVPMEDDHGIAEHIRRFDEKSFPGRIGNSFSLRYFRVFDCAFEKDAKWQGRQLLLIYAADPEGIVRLDMGELYGGWIGDLVKERARLAEALSVKTKDYEDALAAKNAELEKVINQKNSILAQKDKLENSLETLDEEIADAAATQSKAVEEANKFLRVRSRSKPYALAHFIVEARYAFFGNKKERKEGRRYLFGDRKSVTSHNYVEEMKWHIETAGRPMRLLDEKAAELRRERRMDREKDLLKSIISEYKGDTIYCLPRLIDWNVPLFQRPQQIAMGLARNGRLFLYLTDNDVYDSVDSLEKLEDDLMLAPKDYLEMVLETAEAFNKRVVLDLYSTGLYDLKWLSQYDGYSFDILYEYVDEISDEISGFVIPESTLERHRSFLKDPDVYMVATADKLYRDVEEARGDVNVICSGNGVDPSHFQQPVDVDAIPDGIRAIIESGKPIIGYFGAIAVWFDYDLISFAASMRPDYYFMLIGPQYGDSKKTQDDVERLKKLGNVIFTGTIDYEILPHIANNFTVATIPFQLNDITESTSPIKLFEYFAMGKPVVTTAMRECKKYPEVMIANNAEEYVSHIDKAVSIVRGPEYPAYRQMLLDAADRNSWEEKAREIIRLVEKRDI